MDPKACLERAQRELDRGTREGRAECRRALYDYWAWRARDDFEPEGGDELARTIGCECWEQARTGVTKEVAS